MKTAGGSKKRRAREQQGCGTQTAFRKEESRFKYSAGTASLTEAELLGLSSSSSFSADGAFPLRLTDPFFSSELSSLPPPEGILPPTEWKAFGFREHDGFVLIRGAFDGLCSQLRLAQYCLTDCLDAPDHPTNLTPFFGHIPDLFQRASRCQDSADKGTNDCASRSQDPTQEQQKMKSAGKTDLPRDGGHADLSAEEALAREALSKLRWVTLGYHYNWTTRRYEDGLRSPFPQSVGAMADYLVTVAAWMQPPTSGLERSGDHCGESAAECLRRGHFKAEAAIVNFYAARSAIHGHIDDSERNMAAPIVSVSLGCSAVFLLGGADKEQRPSAILLRSGDVALMGGFSRRCLHGVPRVLAGTFPPPEERSSDHLQHAQVLAYLASNRININIRQVFRCGESAEGVSLMSEDSSTSAFATSTSTMCSD